MADAIKRVAKIMADYIVGEPGQSLGIEQVSLAVSQMDEGRSRMRRWWKTAGGGRESGGTGARPEFAGPPCSAPERKALPIALREKSGGATAHEKAAPTCPSTGSSGRVAQRLPNSLQSRLPMTSGKSSLTMALSTMGGRLWVKRPRALPRGMRSCEFNFSAADFERVRKLIYAHAGISLSPIKQDTWRLFPPCPAVARDGKSSFAAYLDALSAGMAARSGAFVNSDHQSHLLLPRAPPLPHLCRITPK